MNICIVGASGFLSNKIVEYSLNKTFAVSVLGRKNQYTDGDIKFFAIDLLENDIPIEICAVADVIIYAAALGVQSSLTISGNDIFSVNAFIPISLVESLKQKSYKGKLITFGSYFEIGNADNAFEQYNEEEIVFAKGKLPNEYCLSKRLLTRYFFDTDCPFTYYHCILPTIYGKGEKANRLIPYLINSIIDQTDIKLSYGMQIRQYLLADDAVSIMFNMINENAMGGIYNFPSAETMNVREIAEIVHQSFQTSLNTKIFGKEERKDQLMRSLKLNFDKLARTINIGALTTLNKYIKFTNNTRWN